MDKDRTEYSQATTPLPEAPVRLLDELMQSGQTTTTAAGTQRFVDRKTGVESKNYYHGLLPREDIIALLDKDGDFLVRTTSISQDEPRKKCLTVCWQDVVRHFILQPTAEKMYTLDLANRTHPEFSSIEKLVEHYLEKGESFSQHNIRLITPIIRQPWEFHHHQIELGEKLGEGAFGEVYSGFLNMSDQRIGVAVKTLKCTRVTKDKIEESMKEARLLRQCRHVNVVRCYGVAAEDEPLMVVMELVKGGSLDSFLMEKGTDLGVTERIQICHQAALAVAYIHSRGILHRDIAARNCLYGDKCLKLSDFGMSRKAVTHKLEGTERVPIRWIAPEVFQTQTYTLACDMWALGILIWEVFNNGQEPYAGWTGAQVKHEVRTNNYRLPMPDWTPAPIMELMKRIWAQNPAERMSSEELANELATILKSRPPESSSYGNSQFGSEKVTPRGSKRSPDEPSASDNDSEKSFKSKISTPDGSHRSHKSGKEKKECRHHSKKRDSAHRRRKSPHHGTSDRHQKHNSNRSVKKNGNVRTYESKEKSRYDAPSGRHRRPSKYAPSRETIDVTIENLTKEDLEPRKSHKSKDKKRRKHGKSKNYECLDSARAKRHGNSGHHHSSQHTRDENSKGRFKKMQYDKSLVSPIPTNQVPKPSSESVSVSKGKRGHH